MTLAFRASDWMLLSPELFLTAAGLLMLALAVAFGKAREEFLAFLATLSIGIAAGLVALVATRPDRATAILGGAFVVDNFALFFKALILFSLALTVLASARYVGSAPYPGGEYYALLLFSGVGMLFMASGNNLISIYVALELMALSSYVLAGYFKAEPKSTEAALKYFILGAFSSGVLLYGLSLVYGVSGRMGLPELAKLLASAERSNLLMLGILLILAGLLFKIAAVPFHVWTPDVYEGSPTPVTAFFSVGPKVAAYAILARIFYVAFPKFQADWGFVVALVSAATMILGNIAALLQSNVKRMLAYSSIANAGYALLGVLGFRTE
ncbi:MAG TPA: NADH-quinone oxidoreductase subunit N, partial [Thermoanaerobaculia bacterium]|nr:NADH-quinone oxidoreductase subunit N [Thermoanaerobaculia bacterium]